MSTTNSLDDDDLNDYVTPQARDLVSSATTVKGPGDSTKYAASYTSTNDYPVYNGGGYYWTITYDSTTQQYQYTARSGSASGAIVAGSTFSSTTPVNIVGANTILVSSGVTLDNVFMSVTGTGAISIQTNATITNSTLVTAIRWHHS